MGRPKDCEFVYVYVSRTSELAAQIRLQQQFCRKPPPRFLQLAPHQQTSAQAIVTLFPCQGIMTRLGPDSGSDKMQIDECPPPERAKATNMFSPDYLRLYYSRLFPFSDMCRWLSYGNDAKHPGCDSSFLGRREFSFTLEHDIYVRYLSFHDANEMESSIREKCPYKIDIGAVYNVDPAKRTAYSSSASEKVFAPVERELVFDVDMTDYDDIRFCCTGADICRKCWPLMTIAIKVVDTALREDFGFEHILWVYSGRRGVHCWVCDAKARRLTNEQRASIAEYFRVYKGSENNTKKVSLSGAVLHPSLLRAYVEVLKPFFEDQILSNQSLLQFEERFEKLLAMIPDDGITSQTRDRWQNNRRTSETEINAARWKQLKSLLETGKQKVPALRRCMEEIIFSYTYPRLDLEVSKHMNHLLKAPFCVHPKTGQVCVPIDPKECDDFDPTAVPTVADLIEELNKGEASQDFIMNAKDRDLTKTSLVESIELFRSQFLHPLLKSCKAEVESAYMEKLQTSQAALEW
ncbi:hypothetical protein GOP47_0008041 [Adiantum capillus-veneris]|uniref:DNA primase n=1 Tax=Adiantum capillus-veneris TaxID=13818 RepID=A0A9D4UXQ5_ADICA|nr:hypothetical protein GOP47_0008041 [Adiantum capillus-veneris]